jgi:hypothetical protein
MQDFQPHSESATNSAMGVVDMKQNKDIGQLVEKNNVGDEYKGQYLQGWRRLLVSIA